MTPAPRPQLSGDDVDDLLISAVRYASGRATYIVSWTVGLVVAQAPWLSERARVVIVRDVRDLLRLHDGDTGVMWQIDGPQWMRVLEVLDPDNTVTALPATLDSADDVRAVCEHYGLVPDRLPDSWTSPVGPQVDVAVLDGAETAVAVAVTGSPERLIERGSPSSDLVGAIWRGLTGREATDA